jgi:cytidylate kinase
LHREFIIAIDGPSGVGKSTLSKLLAGALGYTHLDTGAMYRTVALAARRRDIALGDEVSLARLCREISIDFACAEEKERVLLDGEDVSEAIRTPENSLATSQVSALPAVRDAMMRLQRAMGARGGVVLEGRDTGTVVFAEAEVKFFLTATARERGRRRYEELLAKGLDVNLEQTVAEVEARDLADTARTHAPLQQAADSISIDTTDMGIQEVLEKMLRTVQERRRLAGCRGPAEKDIP